MIKKLRFYKEIGGDWFVDLPKYLNEGIGDKFDLQMVCGADTWLDILSQGEDQVYLNISDNEIEGFEFLEMNQETFVHGLSVGADYECKSYQNIDYNHKLWLCPVTLYVFGEEYPKIIYYKVLS